MLFIPYRVKNPWKNFPIATLSIIALNVLIYLLTTKYFLVIHEDVVKGYAFKFGVSSFFAIFSAMFLHANFFHIAGNMLFLWVFGPPVEDRLRIPRYLLLYFSAGILGFLVEAILDVMCSGSSPYGLGASGCIMGVMGAYWYLFSWSTVCIFYWFFLIFRGVWEVQAFWVIGAYLLIDLAEGIYFAHGGNGVANFAHVAGGATGILLCLAMRMRRDSDSVSRAKETQSEVKDLTLVPLSDLEIMRAADPLNLDILHAMQYQAARMGRLDIMRRAIREVGPQLLDIDPALLLTYLFSMGGDPLIFTPSQLMRLAHHAECSSHPERAINVYLLIREHHPFAPEIEMVLYRLALCYWEKQQDAPHARACLQELLERYPYGSMEPFAKTLLKKLPG